MSYIKFESINKAYEKNEVLRNIDLEIKKGEFVTLLGPSGCGKSTLLRCLAGLESVDSGRIILDGDEVTHKPVEQREIGMVFQQYSLFPNMTIEENIGFGLKMKKWPKEKIKDKVAHMLELVNLQGREKSMPAQLSGGGQQRVALARAIVTEPKVLLLDEPLSAIDAQLRRKLQLQIRRLQQEFQITTLFVTHDQDEAMIMSDRIYLLNNGQVEQEGTPVALYTQPQTTFVAEFMGHYNVIHTQVFNKIGDYKVGSRTVVIRPEVLQISSVPLEVDETYVQFEGEVMDMVSRGNILRYHIKVSKEVVLKVDVLFRTHALFNTGDKVWVNVEKRNCIALD